MISTVDRLIAWDGDIATIEALVRDALAPALPIRWAVVRVEGQSLAIEAAVWNGAEPAFPASLSPQGRARWPQAALPGGLASRSAGAGPFVAAQILPTGIGLAIGGHAGDGTPATNLLAVACDRVVTHPNAVNAALFNWAEPGVLYVEGALLDAWLAGRIALRPVRSNRVGLLVDRGVAEAGGLTLVENAAAAFRTVGGGQADMLLTREPLALSLEQGASGASHGSLANPDVLVSGARCLLERGAEAIALVADFSRLPLDAAPYLSGSGPDPIGGLEAILSHAVTLTLGVPCAHAPYLDPSAEPCDPRVAAEELHGGFVTSILRGLQRAPRPIAPADAGPGDVLAPDVVVAPDGALGGPGTLAAAARGIPIVAVRNPSVLGASAAALGISAIPAASYLEAAGIALALKAGLEGMVIGQAPLGSPGGSGVLGPVHGPPAG